MYTVTNFVKKVKQPRGGFIPPSSLTKHTFEDGMTLSSFENIHSVLVGITVDLLTRVGLFGKNLTFDIQIMGAHIAGESALCQSLVDRVNDVLTDDSIRAACKLSGFDVCFRSGMAGYKDVRNIEPDATTINNIRIMVQRSMIFFNKKKVISSGVTFLGGYTRVVSKGDADFLTPEGIWDMKVSVRGPLKEHTLQVYVYTQLAYAAGLNGNPTYDDCEFNVAGIFNPRLNTEYYFDPTKIEPKYIGTIQTLIEHGF